MKLYKSGLKRKSRIFVLLFLLIFFIFGCGNSISPAPEQFGTVRVLLTDFPLQGVEKVYITIYRVEIHSEEMGWATIVDYTTPDDPDDFDGEVFELLELAGGVTAVLGEEELEAGLYTQIRLVLGGDHSLIVNGEEKALVVPSGEQSGIKLTGDFVVNIDSVTTITLDFDAEKSLILTGNGEYKLKPVITILEVTSTVEDLWSVQLGTAGDDYVYGGLAADSIGNVYVTGFTDDSLSGTNAGERDLFVVKYDSGGTMQWVRQLGTSGSDLAQGVAADSVGNVCVTGYTAGSLAETNAGYDDFFVVKYDSAGNTQWTRQLGTACNDFAQGVATDSVGNIYVTGGTGGSLAGTNAGNYDLFVIKYDSGGTLQWARQLGTSGYDSAWGVATDSVGNVYVAGYTAGSLAGTNAGGTDLFVAKYDSVGTMQWTRQLGTAGYDIAKGVATDSNGNVYVTGYTGGSLDGNSAGYDDLFVVKYDSGGNLQWARQLGTADYDYAFGVAADSNGNVYVTGYTGGSLSGINAGGTDLFVVRYDSEGTMHWIRQLGTTANDLAYGTAIDSTGNVFVTGHTNGSIAGTNAGNYDFFVLKYDGEGNLK